MGEIGLTKYSDSGSNLGFLYRSGSNMNMNAIGVNFGTTLQENSSSSLYSESVITYGAGHFDKDRYSSQVNLESKLNYTLGDGFTNTVFLNPSVHADVSYNKSYSQDVSYAVEFGPYIGAKTDSNNQLALDYRVGNHLVNNSSSRTDGLATVDVAAGIGLAAGINDPSSQTYIFGTLNQEFTNKKNTTATVGIGHTRNFEIFNCDFNVSATAGYRHNFNKNDLTNNLMKHPGAFIEGGVSVCF